MLPLRTMALNPTLSTGALPSTIILYGPWPQPSALAWYVVLNHGRAVPQGPRQKAVRQHAFGGLGADRVGWVSRVQALVG